MDPMNFQLLLWLFLIPIFFISHSQYVYGQDYYSFDNIPNEVNTTFGDLINSVELDLNIISSLVAPEIDPRNFVDQEIDEEKLEAIKNENYNGNLEQGVTALKKFSSDFTASGSDSSDTSSDEFSEARKIIQDKFDFSQINLTENLGITLGILNSIAIITMAVIIKIKLSKSKIIVEKPSKI